MPKKQTLAIDPQVLQLMGLYDEEFIENAYQAILDRTPDESGLANYLPKVRSGVHRGHIILELAESAEGRSKRNDVPAIRAYFGRFRDPDPGPMKLAFRRIIGRSGASPERRHRAVENQLCALRASIATLLSQQAHLQQSIQEIATRIGRTSSIASPNFNGEGGAGQFMLRLPPRIARTVQELKAAIALKRDRQ